MSTAFFTVLLAIASGLDAQEADTRTSAEARARANALQAQEALNRSLAVVNAYLKLRDPVTGLLPRKEGEPCWYVRDSAADLYPFLVLGAYFTGRADVCAHEVSRELAGAVAQRSPIGRGARKRRGAFVG